MLAGPRTIRDLLAEMTPVHEASVVIAAAYRVAGDLLAAGRLDIPLDRVVFTLDTRIKALAVDAAPILPPGVITSIDELTRLADEMGGPTEDRTPDVELDPTEQILDLDAIVDARTRDLVARRRAAIARVDVEGASAAAAAREFGLGVRRLQQVLAAYRIHGEAAFYPHASYTRPDLTLPDEMLALIRRLYAGTICPSVTDIKEDVRVHELAAGLGLRRTPSEGQILEGHRRPPTRGSEGPATARRAQAGPPRRQRPSRGHRGTTGLRLRTRRGDDGHQGRRARRIKRHPPTAHRRGGLRRDSLGARLRAVAEGARSMGLPTTDAAGHPAEAADPVPIKAPVVGIGYPDDHPCRPGQDQ